MTRGILLVVVLLVATPTWSHPGRLDTDGCHHVRKDFVYASGKIVRKGDYHCHRLLIGKDAKLDGREVLGERGDQHKDDAEDGNDAQTP